MTEQKNLTSYFDVLSISSKVSACSSSGYGLMTGVVCLFLMARVGYFLVGYFAALSI